MNTNLKSSFENAQDFSLEPTGETATSIRLFRAAMHSIAEREAGRPLAADWLAPARRRHRRAQGRMILVWACAVALCFAVVPNLKHTPAAPHSGIARSLPEPPHSDISDTALLEQVDNAISEPVPSSLAPLTELDNWNSLASTTRTENTNVTQ